MELDVFLTRPTRIEIPSRTVTAGIWVTQQMEVLRTRPGGSICQQALCRAPWLRRKGKRRIRGTERRPYPIRRLYTPTLQVIQLRPRLATRLLIRYPIVEEQVIYIVRLSLNPVDYTIADI